jgi:DNA-directed RNA polymerase subunit RPC12/RpoP
MTLVYCLTCWREQRVRFTRGFKLTDARCVYCGGLLRKHHPDKQKPKYQGGEHKGPQTRWSDPEVALGHYG